MTRYRTLWLAALLAGLALGAAAAPAATRPIVVELFTSQGCSSCPPADALLRELAGRDGILALGFHISYWDGLGWKDPLSSEASTERQRAYARHFNGGQVYTPQMIVEGTREMVGSDRAAVLAAVREARPETVAPVAFAADRRSVAIGGGVGRGQVMLVRFIRHRTTDVAAGENSGRVIEDANGVETLTRLATWQGTPLTLPIEPPGAGEGVAILVQAPDGPILGAARLLGSD
ncbi:MAG TPA: DUF1223 domain-containing protein [Stellaceae bacterium]|nr:DUF1223 domain-containing protein [Stellaceae bacterium]